MNGDDLMNDNSEDDDPSPPELQGTLSKWTNYIHGWQDRYVALRSNGSLQYYKSERETDFGCRGAISIGRASVRSHELDDLRFDISVNSDCVWYLRAKSIEDRTRWIDALEAYKVRQQHLHHPNDSPFTNKPVKQPSKRLPEEIEGDLKEKLGEIRTFKDILCKQIDSLQFAFESPTKKRSSASILDTEEVDFKAESITFKATTEGIVSALAQMVHLVEKRDEFWRKKLEHEIERNKKLEFENLVLKEEKKIENLLEFDERTKLGHDYHQEGPNSQIGDDEFYDAVENALNKLQEEQNYRDKLKLMSEKPLASSNCQNKTHPLWSTVEKITTEQLHYARLPVGDIWELFAEDGEMKMYKREEEVDGLVVDPLKAVHHVKGVTARELCHFFFAPEYRQEWEATVEQATVLEKISEDTLIFLQLHKRIWPAAQRDSLFWSHRRKVKDVHENGESDTWLVCNQSTKHPDAPENTSGSCMRIDLTVIFVCDTLINNGKSVKNCSRNDVSCKITYCSVVNPGGWVPAAALRAVYKREYPKFLKRFTAYVLDKTKNNPILW